MSTLSSTKHPTPFPPQPLSALVNFEQLPSKPLSFYAAQAANQHILTLLKTDLSLSQRSMSDSSSQESILRRRIEHKENIFSTQGTLLPRKVQDARAKIIKNALKKENRPPLNKGAFLYHKDSSDFGRRVRTLLVMCDFKQQNKASRQDNLCVARITHLLQDLEKVAKQEGFNVTYTDHPYWVRDHHMRIPPSKHCPSSLVCGASRASAEEIDPEQRERNITLSLKRAQAKEYYFCSSAQAISTHPIFTLSAGGAYQSALAADLEHHKRFKIPSMELCFPLEGGNVFSLTNKAQKIKTLIGDAAFSSALAFLRLENRFSNGQTPAPKAGLTQEQIKPHLEEMYAMGLILFKGKTGALESPQMGLLNFETVGQADKNPLEIGIKRSWTHPFPNLSAVATEKYRKNAELFAGQKEFTRQIFEQIFNFQQRSLNPGGGSRNVIFIPQAAYHLDLFLTPGPKGSIFLQDYALTTRLLQEIAKHPELFKLSKSDLTILDRYKEAATLLQTQLDPLLLQAKALLEAADFTVIPSPGVILDAPLCPKNTVHVNFMNGISGYSEKSKEFYYITTGASAGNRLGEALMDLFTLHLQEYLPHLHVYFLGQGDPHPFKEAMFLWNGNGLFPSSKGAIEGPHAGIHCATFELEADSYTHT